MPFLRAQVIPAVIGAVMVWLGAATVFGGAGLLRWTKLRGDRVRLGEETMHLARETHALEQRIARLSQGDGLEAVAREQLGMVRPDEIVYRFHRPPGTVR